MCDDDERGSGVCVRYLASWLSRCKPSFGGILVASEGFALSR